MSPIQRGLLCLALAPAVAGLVLTSTIAATGRVPSGLVSWVIVILACAPAMAAMLRYYCRSLEPFAIAAATTTAGTILALAVSYAAIWVGALLSLWVWMVMTDSSVRASSVALTSGITLLVTLAAPVWRKLN